MPEISLDRYAVAYLAGGPERVAETALVALRDDGAVTVAVPHGELHAVATRPGHPVEVAVLAIVSGRRHCSADAVRLGLADAPALTEVRDRLVAAGLVRRWAGAGRWRTRLVLTRAGRRELRRLMAEPGGGGASLVALHGPRSAAEWLTPAAGPVRQRADGDPYVAGGHASNQAVFGAGPGV